MTRILSCAMVLLLMGAPQLYAQDRNVSVFGDFRLRYENTSNQERPIAPLPDHQDARNREVVRLRAGVIAVINDLFQVGARLATGSSDDPNTTDVTLGNFVNDLEFSLDRVYVSMEHEGLSLMAGKFANPFFRGNDFVWDGDVNPQGVGGSYTYSRNEQVVPTFTAVYMVIDEQTFAPDSYMWGAQASVAVVPTSSVGLTLSGAYYNYTIASLNNADAGDTRSNRLTPDGTAYLSDFDLLDATAVLTHQGLGERRSLRVVGNFVKNFGAAGDDDTGFSFDLFLGRTSEVKDTRFRYGYSAMERDAVFAAFSHDNTTLATNYRQHTFTIDWVALPNTTLNATWYLFRRDILEAASDSDQFVSRLRLNTSLSF